MQAIFDKVIADFIYTPDREQFNLRDYWASHAEEVEQGVVWKDDCDGFAITCAELLAKAGYDKVSLIYCKTETGDGHLVCGVADNGDTYILDNRQRKVWSWSLIKYQWVSQMLISDPGTWREILT